MLRQCCPAPPHGDALDERSMCFTEEEANQLAAARSATSASILHQLDLQSRQHVSATLAALRLQSSAAPQVVQAAKAMSKARKQVLIEARNLLVTSPPGLDVGVDFLAQQLQQLEEHCSQRIKAAAAALSDNTAT